MATDKDHTGSTSYITSLLPPNGLPGLRFTTEHIARFARNEAHKQYRDTEDLRNVLADIVADEVRQEFIRAWEKGLGPSC